MAAMREQLASIAAQPQMLWSRPRGEAAGTGSGRRPGRIKARLTGDGGRVAAPACGDQGRVHDVDKEQQCRQHSDRGAQQEGAARHSVVGASEPANLEGHRLGETETAREELLHTTQKPEEEVGRPLPHEASCEAPGELVPQGGEHEGSPGARGGDCSGVQRQVDLATESLTDAMGYHLVPMYQVIGLSVALLILLLMGILRMMLDIVIRAITIVRVRSCRWWLMGSFWGVLFQVAVVPVQWTMAKGHTIGKAVTCQMSTEAAHLQIEDAEAQMPSPEDVGGSSAPGTHLNGVDRLVSWPIKFLSRRDTDQIYLVPIIKGEQVAMGDTAADRDTEDEDSRRRSTPLALRLLT